MTGGQEHTDVSRVQEPILREHARGLVWGIVVAQHVATRLQEDLAIISDLELTSRQRPPYGAKHHIVGRVHTASGGRLREAVALADRDANRVKEQRCL